MTLRANEVIDQLHARIGEMKRERDRWEAEAKRLNSVVEEYRELSGRRRVVTNVDFTKWLNTVSDARLRQIMQFVHAEGIRRGWSQF